MEVKKPTVTRQRRKKTVPADQANESLEELFHQTIADPATLEPETVSVPLVIRDAMKDDSNPPSNLISISTETHQSSNQQKNDYMRNKLHDIFGITSHDLMLPTKKKRGKAEQLGQKYEEWDESIVTEKVERTRITDETQIVPAINEKKEAFMEVMRKFDAMDK